MERKGNVINERIFIYTGEAKFVSATFRLFKLPQTKLSTSHVTYNGNILGCLDQLQFDYAIAFKVWICLMHAYAWDKTDWSTYYWLCFCIWSMNMFNACVYAWDKTGYNIYHLELRLCFLLEVKALVNNQVKQDS